MKTFLFKTFTIISLFLMVSHLYAQEANQIPQTQNSHAMPEDLMHAFQKEYVYLASQKQALLNVQKKSVESFKKQASTFKNKTLSLQSELVSLSAKNDEQQDYLISLEKRKKELEKKGSSLESSYKKAQVLIQDMALGLSFSLEKDKGSLASGPEDLKISSFENLFLKAQDLIIASSQTDTFSGAFLNLDDQLVEGSITRFGRSAAIGTINDEHFILAPNGNGLLKAISSSDSPSGAFAHLFVFDNLQKEAQVKYKSTFIEKIADISPLLFLGLILMLVGGLFTALIKV